MEQENNERGLCGPLQPDILWGLEVHLAGVLEESMWTLAAWYSLEPGAAPCRGSGRVYVDPCSLISSGAWSCTLQGFWKLCCDERALRCAENPGMGPGSYGSPKCC